MTQVPVVLTIAGSDPSGGAGVQGDLRALAALGAWGCAVVTALTVQDARGVHAVHAVPADFVRRQLEVVLRAERVDAVKVGMLGVAEVVRAVAAVLRMHPDVPTVLDPVLRASAGGRLLDGDGLAALRDELLPLVTLVTPNTIEAGALLGAPPPRTEAEAIAAGGAIRALGARAVLVTGGHLDTPGECVDVLVDGASARASRVPRIDGAGTHGTGCALSTAIAVGLATGASLDAACAAAQRFVLASLRTGARMDVLRAHA